MNVKTCPAVKKKKELFTQQHFLLLVTVYYLLMEWHCDFMLIVNTNTVCAVPYTFPFYLQDRRCDSNNMIMVFLTCSTSSRHKGTFPTAGHHRETPPPLYNITRVFVVCDVLWLYVHTEESLSGVLPVSVAVPLPVSQLQVPGGSRRVLNRVVLKDLQRKK